MDKERNTNQIVRKDGKGCFVESLNDAFSIGRCHLAFAAYDLNRPAGERQTNLVQIYLDCGELLDEFVLASGANAMLVGPDGELVDTGARLTVYTVYEDERVPSPRRRGRRWSAMGQTRTPGRP